MIQTPDGVSVQTRREFHVQAPAASQQCAPRDSKRKLITIKIIYILESVSKENKNQTSCPPRTNIWEQPTASRVVPRRRVVLVLFCTDKSIKATVSNGRVKFTVLIHSVHSNLFVLSFNMRGAPQVLLHTSARARQFAADLKRTPMGCSMTCHHGQGGRNTLSGILFAFLLLKTNKNNAQTYLRARQRHMSCSDSS